ncbi:par-3 family cell polarity regulator beta a [Eucyclogobius newberryi]|uniref:par-3 family cell polarity regulator beta a n=1 Tax=Eucyclogobius newberryi TaxID=166745 RepID=UPI003B5C751D
MKVTVTFGNTAVVVPCKAGWTVKDLVDQATRRYRRILDQQQQGDSVVHTHHLEYSDGGILDMDDPLADLVEDREKLMAVFELEREPLDSPRESLSNLSNGYSSSSPVPEPGPVHYHPHLEYPDPAHGEIEVNEATLKGNTPLLVRSSSDSVVPPTITVRAISPPDDRSVGTPEPELNNVLKGALERLRVEEQQSRMSPVNQKSLTELVEFPGNCGPLGIHVVPYNSSLSGRTLGLHIRGIEATSRSRKENLFQEEECIVQINDTSLLDKTFAQSQEVFRQAMSAPIIRCEVLPAANKLLYEKSLIGNIFTSDSRDSSTKASPLVVRSRAGSQPLDPNPRPKIDLRRPETKTPEPPKDPPQAAEVLSGYGSSDTQSPIPPAGRSPVAAALASLTNKKGGKKIKINLKKGPEGLGFTVVTRDSTVHGPGPILVKNILQRGAAIKDGRLLPGDRILEVNGVDMMGRSQEELVAMLRSTKLGENVSMVVARQEDIFLPRELKGEEASSLGMDDGRELLMFEVPLNESGSAGLGVSLKGNKSRETGEDLGIFIKSIIHGGAAYKDGRLCVNDQLIAVNGESLEGHSNHVAMETLRRSMSSEGNARGTIQLVVLRAAKQIAAANRAASPALPAASSTHPGPPPPVSSNQNSLDYDVPPGPLRPTYVETHTPATQNNFPAPFVHVANRNNYSNYSNSRPDDLNDSFPPPPSPGAVEEMNRELPLTPPHYREFQTPPFYSDGNLKDNHRASKSMDLVPDEGNIRSLTRPQNDPAEGGARGPNLGLVKSSSLESLQTAMEEVRHSSAFSQVPFHKPRPHMVRQRGSNMSFRQAIDKSYEGPSEDDDDLSDRSSGHETQASTSSRNDLEADESSKKKKKTKGKKKEKKTKTKKEPVEDPDRKKKKGFGLLRFGKKKDDKNKGSKTKLDALSEEELDRVPDQRDGADPRYVEAHTGYVTPDIEDEDDDPHYARINDFRQNPSVPQPYRSRTPSPAAPALGQRNPAHASAEDLEELYAKVNKPRKPAYNDPNQSDGGPRREHQASRAVPGYDELDAARRRALEYDPNRMAPRANETLPSHHYEEIGRQFMAPPRRDPYDYPRPISKDPGYDPRERLPPPQSSNPPHQTRTANADQRGRQQYHEPAKAEGYREASPGRYIDTERYGYGDGRQPDPRRKNTVIGAV